MTSRSTNAARHADGDRDSDARRRIALIGATESLRHATAALAPDYRVTSCSDADEVLASADTLRPDLIVVSLFGCSIADGRRVFGALQSHPSLRPVPVLALVPDGVDPEGVARWLDLGVRDVLRLPLTAAEVRARVRNLIEVKRAREVLGELAGARHDDELARLAAAAVRKRDELHEELAAARAERARAERDNQIKSGFLRMMSHELKTPLTAMQLQMELLERDPNVAALQRVRDGHARIRRSARRLLQLIDTMLEWARAESGRTRLFLERFDLVALVDDLMRELGAAHPRQLALELHVDEQLQRNMVGDRRLVRLVLFHLLSRALQVTPAGKVEVHLDQVGAERRIAITDAAPHRGAVELEPFDATRPSGASGLALYVVRDIARTLGGQLEAQDAHGQGHVLTLTLPDLAGIAAAQAGAALGDAAGQQRPHA